MGFRSRLTRAVSACGSLAGGALVLLGGFSGFEKVMKALIATMFFSIVACAALTFEAPGAVLRGLTVPTIPPDGGSSVLSVLGGVGGSIAMLAYNYWLREERMAGAKWLRFVRADIAIAYVFTAIFAMSSGSGPVVRRPSDSRMTTPPV